MGANNSVQEQLSLQILPWDINVTYPRGETLMSALNRGGIYFQNTCEKKGSCGRCKVEVLTAGEQNYKELMACNTVLGRSARVKVPTKNVLVD